ncbi:hypothetical protein JCM6882_009342, partial [Rhodosporidiobolus microsporus]
MSLRLISPSAILVGSFAAAVLAADSNSKAVALAKRALPLLGNARAVVLFKAAAVLLLALNYRALPFFWHIDFYGLIPKLYWRIWTKGDEKAMAIARDPFEVKTITRGRVTFAESDYNI